MRDHAAFLALLAVATMIGCGAAYSVWPRTVPINKATEIRVYDLLN
jgi:hypothetical protein